MPSEKRPSKPKQAPAPQPDREEIEAQLERIITSESFDPTDRSRRFLSFIVEQALEGEFSSISQYAIATELFGRGSGFDPAADPIVRIQAGRLRQWLDRYYLTSGADDPITISVPKGSYVPKFNYRNPTSTPAAGTPPNHDLGAVLREASEWPAVLITPFRNLSGRAEYDYLPRGLATELGIELDRYQIVRVCMHDSPVTADGSQPAAPWHTHIKFSIEGSIETRGESLNIMLRLLDTVSGVQIWGRSFRYKVSDPGLSSSLDKVALAVAAALADERGIITRHLIREQRTLPLRNSCYDTVLRFYHLISNPSPEGFPEILEAMRQAVEADPEHALSWSLLGRLYGLNHILELSTLETPLDDALEYSRKAAQLEPENARIRTSLAYLCMLSDDIEMGRREAEAALSLDPNSLHSVDIVGYLLVLLGDWDRGVTLIRKSIELNPFHSPVAHFALWLNHMRTSEYELAYQEAIELGTFGRYWPPIARASALGHLGRKAEGSAAVDELLVLMPDFPKRWRWVLSRFVHFDELMEIIASGLRKCGLRLPKC